MDEDKFQYATLTLLALIFISVLWMSSNDVQLQHELEGCPQVLDLIYEQCVEENNISITTIRGTNTNLVMENGRCVIK